MPEYVLKNQQPIPNKAPGGGKKHHGVLIAIIIILIIIILLPLITAGVLFALIYDSSHKDVDYDQNVTTQQVFNGMMVDSLDPTVSEKKMNLRMTERHMNTIMHVAFQNKVSLGLIKNFYVLADNGNYHFNFELQALNFIKTTVEIGTELHILPEENGSDTLEFKIVSLRVGKLRNLINSVNKLVSILPVGDLENVFASSGLSIKVDMDNLRLTYNSNDFYNDLINILDKKDGSNNDYVQILSEILAQRQLRTIYYRDDIMFGVEVPIDNLKVTSATYGIEDYELPDSAFVTENIHTTVASEIKSLLDQGKLVLEDKLETFARYLYGGYDFLNETEKERMDDMGPRAYGDSFLTRTPLYDYTLSDDKMIKNIVQADVKEQVDAAIPIPPYHMPDVVNTEVNTDQINDMMRHSRSVGITNYFVRNVATDGTNNYKVNYVTIDNLTTLIKDNVLYFILNINFNGNSGQLTLKCSKVDDPGSEFGLLVMSIDAMYIGDYKVSDKTLNTFLTTITNSLDIDLFTVEEGKIKFNISAAMSGGGLLTSYYSLEFTFEDSTTTLPGKIKLQATRTSDPPLP